MAVRDTESREAGLISLAAFVLQTISRLEQASRRSVQERPGGLAIREVAFSVPYVLGPGGGPLSIPARHGDGLPLALVRRLLLASDAMVVMDHDRLIETAPEELERLELRVVLR